MTELPLSTHEKALRLNLDRGVYGAFAEIGAGQEVARWFFQVGHAAGTVAKTISAYDMTVSDALYGRAARYVSRQRLESMLDYEWNLLLERLDSTRGDNTAFFVFADTVATRNASRQQDGHGWMGVRFQAQPRQAPSEVVMHVNTLDRDRVHEQEALGSVGVNLLHAVYYRRDEAYGMLDALLENLSRDRVEIDMIRCCGPAFAGVDNRLVSLQLVQKDFTDAAMFTADGEVVQPADALYKKPLLIERGRFRPVTKVSLDLLERARAQFIAGQKLDGEAPVVLMEMTLAGLTSEQGVDHRDFLSRVDTLGQLGNTVLISKHALYYGIVQYLCRFTDAPVGIALGVPALAELTRDEHYTALAGGTLESIGRLFKHNVHLYVYPTRDRVSGRLVTVESIDLPGPARHLMTYLLETDRVEAIREFDADLLGINAPDVLRRIQTGDASWESDVPASIVDVIKQKRLFGYR